MMVSVNIQDVRVLHCSACGLDHFWIPSPSGLSDVHPKAKFCRLSLKSRRISTKFMTFLRTRAGNVLLIWTLFTLATTVALSVVTMAHENQQPMNVDQPSQAWRIQVSNYWDVGAKIKPFEKLLDEFVLSLLRFWDRFRSTLESSISCLQLFRSKVSTYTTAC